MKKITFTLKNTSRYPDAEVKVLVAVAIKSLEDYLPERYQFGLKLTNSSHGFRGKAFYKRILVRVGGPHRFPVTASYWTFKDMPVYEVRTYREAIVGITAHELMHLCGKSGRKDGELWCEMAAIDAIELYRRRQQEIDEQADRARSRVLKRTASERFSRTPLGRARRAVPAAEKKLKRWGRKAKLAQTMLKKVRRELARARKRLEQLNEQNENLDVTPSGADSRELQNAAKTYCPSAASTAARDEDRCTRTVRADVSDDAGNDNGSHHQSTGGHRQGLPAQA